MKSGPKSSREEVFGRVQRRFPRVRRILVPLDFSGKSRQALEFAGPMGERFGARIILLHVLPGKKEEAEHGRTAGDLTQKRAAAHKRLKETGQKLLPPGMVEQTLVCVGKPSLEIVDAARRLQVDLIAIATHGHAGIKRLLLGSTTEQVLRLASCPVLTVRRRQH